MRWLDGIIDTMDMSLSKLWEIVWHAAVPGANVRNSTHDKGHEEGGLAYAKA